MVPIMIPVGAMAVPVPPCGFRTLGVPWPRPPHRETTMRIACLLSWLTATVLTAQASGDRVVVLSRTTSPAASALLDVDLTTGVVRPIDRFSLDRFPPLAVAIDSVNGDIVAALQTPVGSVLTRLGVAGTRLLRQDSLGDVPGFVTALAQALDGTWIATTDLGVYATERNGGVARAIVALSGVSAIETFGLGSTQALIAQSGSATSDPQLRWIDLTTGQTLAGPWVYVGYTPRGITGVGDLPTGAVRHVLSQEDGTIAISLGFANPTTLPLAPTLPPGATAAMHVRGLEGVVLGGSAHPFLKSFQALGGTQWTMLAGPLPGDPVDFAFRPRGPATVSFGGTCNTMLLAEVFGGGPPHLGNATYALQLASGMPSAAAFLALGASDQRFFRMRLPTTLPGGCQAHISFDLVTPTITSGAGASMVTIGVPNSPALLDAVAFAQWLQARGGGLDSSNAAAIRIGM